MVISADTDFYAECSAGAGIELGVGWGWWSQSIRSACGLSEARECCGFGQDDDLSAQCCGDFRGASAWWCGTGEGSGLLHGRPDEVMALSGSAQFLAAGLEPAQWLPGSDEGKTKCKGNFQYEIYM